MHLFSELEDLERKVDMILHPLITRQINDFIDVYVDKESPYYSKCMHLIGLKLNELGKDCIDK